MTIALPKDTPEELRFDVTAPLNADPTVTDQVYRHRLLLLPLSRLIRDNSHRLDHYLPASGMLTMIIVHLEKHGVVQFEDVVPLWLENNASDYKSWVKFVEWRNTWSTEPNAVRAEHDKPINPPVLTPEELTMKLIEDGAALAWKLATELLQQLSPR